MAGRTRGQRPPFASPKVPLYELAEGACVDASLAPPPGYCCAVRELQSLAGAGPGDVQLLSSQPHDSGFATVAPCILERSKETLCVTKLCCAAFRKLKRDYFFLFLIK